MAISITFDNRQQSIAFFEAFGGMPNTVAALKEAEQQAAYAAALALVDGIEPHPTSSRLTVHWRNAGGELLTTLDEVVRAALAGELVCNG